MQGDERVLEKFKRAQASLVLQMSDLPLQAISAMVDAGAIDIQPKYQRRERWSVEKQSALIESFLINIPVPPVYLSEAGSRQSRVGRSAVVRRGDIDDEGR